MYKTLLLKKMCRKVETNIIKNFLSRNKAHFCHFLIKSELSQKQLSICENSALFLKVLDNFISESIRRNYNQLKSIFLIRQKRKYFIYNLFLSIIYGFVETDHKNLRNRLCFIELKCGHPFPSIKK